MLILSDKVVHVWISSRKPLVCQNPRIALGLAKARPLGHANVQGQTRHSNVLQLPGSKRAQLELTEALPRLLIYCYRFFRYYIREPVVKKKLPCKFPLTKPTLELLEKVTNYVLNKSMIKQPSFR